MIKVYSRTLSEENLQAIPLGMRIFKPSKKAKEEVLLRDNERKLKDKTKRRPLTDKDGFGWQYTSTYESTCEGKARIIDFNGESSAQFLNKNNACCRPALSLLYNRKCPRFVYYKQDWEKNQRYVMNVRLIDNSVVPCWVTNDFKRDNVYELLPVEEIMVGRYNVINSDYKNSEQKIASDWFYENLAKEFKKDAVAVILDDENQYNFLGYKFTLEDKRIIYENIKEYRKVIGEALEEKFKDIKIYFNLVFEGKINEEDLRKNLQEISNTTSSSEEIDALEAFIKTCAINLSQRFKEQAELKRVKATLNSRIDDLTIQGEK